MDNAISILRTLTRAGRPVTISVTGHSMQPLLRAGDQITVQRQETYQIGDILVFVYLDGSLLVHRLVRREGETLFCKGDNAFRLEPLLQRQVIGRVVDARRNEQPLPILLSPRRTNLLCRLSAAIGARFSRQPDINKIREDWRYRLYARLFLTKEENPS